MREKGKFSLGGRERTGAFVRGGGNAVSAGMADGETRGFFRCSRKNRKFFEKRAKFIDFFFGICYTVLAFRARQTVFVCGCGEIGRHARLRIWCLRMQVQVLSSAPNVTIFPCGNRYFGV